MENSQPVLCYGDEENARIYTVHLTTANQSEIRRVYLVSVMESVDQNHSEFGMTIKRKNGVWKHVTIL